MGIDPQDYKEGELHTYNRYAYGANNPYKYVDPDGRAIQFLFWVFAGGATYHEMSKPVTLDEYGDAALVSIPYPMGPLGGIGPGTKAGKSLLSSPHINPKDIAGKTPSQIDKLAKDKGLISKGSNPKSGKGAYIDPATGKQRVLCHTNCADPHAHVNNPQGKRLDINGKVVPPESPAAHLPINYP